MHPSIPSTPHPARSDLSDALLSAIIESSDDAIISKDLDGIITSWNQGAERIFGYTADEAVGRSVLMLIPADRQHEEPHILSQLRRGERVDHYETIRVRKDGSPIDISLTVSPVRDAGGTIVGASKIARDITDRKRIEAERAEHAVRLERALAQRTLELTESHEARRRTEAMAVLGALSAGIAHDLSNLLLPMRTRLALLERMQDVPPPVREHLIALVKSVDYIAELGQRVRGYMSDAGKESPKAASDGKNERIELSAWCRQVEPFLSTIVPSDGLESIIISSHIDDRLPMLSLNRTALTQAAYNLVQNAVKAIRDSGVGGTINIRGWAGGNHSVYLGVLDDGPGMTPDVLARCLEPRFTTDIKGGGSGMGLALVKAFVDQSGGELRVFSPPSEANVLCPDETAHAVSNLTHGTAVIMRFDASSKDHD